MERVSVIVTAVLAAGCLACGGRMLAPSADPALGSSASESAITSIAGMSSTTCEPSPSYLRMVRAGRVIDFPVPRSSCWLFAPGRLLGG